MTNNKHILTFSISPFIWMFYKTISLKNNKPTQKRRKVHNVEQLGK